MSHRRRASTRGDRAMLYVLYAVMLASGAAAVLFVGLLGLLVLPGLAAAIYVAHGTLGAAVQQDEARGREDAAPREPG